MTVIFNDNTKIFLSGSDLTFVDANNPSGKTLSNISTVVGGNTSSLGDPDVKLLLHFDGTAGTSVFTDSSNNPMTFNTAGTVQLSSTQAKFGSTSLALNGTNTNILSGSNNKLAFSNNAFTIEGWFYFNSNNIGYQPLICLATTADFQGPIIILETNNTLAAYASSNGTSWNNNITTSYVPPTGQWIHIAYVGEGNVLKLYANGVLVGSVTTYYNVVTAKSVYMGHYPYFPGGARTFNGYIDDVRITVGRAQYLQPFTPPTAAFADAMATTTVTNTVFSSSIPNPRYAPISSSHIVVWKFNDFTGSTTAVNAGTALTGTLSSNGRVDFGRTGLFETAAGFPLTTAASLQGSPGLIPNKDRMSLSCWVYPISFPGAATYGRIISKWYGPTFSNPFESVALVLNNTNDGQWYFQYTVGGVIYGSPQVVGATIPGNRLKLNQWNHVGASYNNDGGVTQVKLFFNGNQVLQYNQTPAGSLDFNSTGNWVINNPVGSASYGQWVGEIDDYRVINEALSASWFYDTYAKGIDTVYNLTSSALVASGGAGGTIYAPMANIISSSFPFAGLRGEPSDGGYPLIYTGTEWRNIVGTRRCKRPPTISALTWVNQGGATAVDSNCGITVNETGTFAGNSRRILVEPRSTASPYTFTVGMHVSNLRGTAAPLPLVGILVRDGVGGRMVAMQLYWSSGYFVAYEKWTGPTEVSPVGYMTVRGMEDGWIGKPIWMRMVDDGTNLTPYYSTNGIKFYRVDTVNHTRADWVPSGGNQVGVMFQEITNNSSMISAEIFEWDFTNP